MQSSAAREGPEGEQRAKRPNPTPSSGQKMGQNSASRGRDGEIHRDSLNHNTEGAKPDMPQAENQLFSLCVCHTHRILAQRGEPRIWEVVEHRGEIKQTWVSVLPGIQITLGKLLNFSMPRGFFLHLQSGSKHS